MLTNTNSRLLLTEAKINTQYSTEEFISGVWKVLIGSFLLLSFILPDINEQGQERKRDENIALYSMLAAVISSGIMQLLERMPLLKPKWRDLLYIGFNHFSNSTYDTGIILEFLHGIANLLNETYGDNGNWLRSISDWLAGNNAGIRSVIAALAVLVGTIAGTYLRHRELFKKSEEDDGILLRPNEANQRTWNRYSRVHWGLKMLGTFCKNYVFSSLPILIMEGFNISLNESFKRAYPFIMAGLTILHLIPDHPFVSKYESVQQIKKFSRFADKMFVMTLFNSSLAFMLHMDLVSLFNNKQHINIANSTAATTLLGDIFLALHYSEVDYRIVSVLNDTKITVSALLRNWDFVNKLSKSMVAWGKVFAGNPWAAIGASILAVLDFMADFIDTRQLTAWKRIMVQLADSLNHGLLNTGLLVQLANLERATLVVKSAVSIPAAIFFTAARQLAKQYPTLNRILNPIDYALLGSGMFSFVNFLANDILDNNIRYAFVGVSATAMLLGQGYDYFATRNKKQTETSPLLYDEESNVSKSVIHSPMSSPKNPINILKTQEHKTHASSLFFRSKSLAKAVPYLESVSAAFVFLVGMAVFNQTMQAYDDGPTAETGRTMMKILVVFCALVMLASLLRNTFYKNSDNNINNELIGSKMRKCLTAIDVFGLCKSIPVYDKAPDTPKNKRHTIVYT